MAMLSIAIFKIHSTFKTFHMNSRKLRIVLVMVTALILGGFALYEKRLVCERSSQSTSQSTIDLNRNISDLEAVTLADAYVYAAKTREGTLAIEREVGTPLVRSSLRYTLENVDLSILVKGDSAEGLLLAGWSGRFGVGNVTFMAVIKGCVYPFNNDMKRGVEMSELMLAAEKAWNEVN